MTGAWGTRSTAHSGIRALHDPFPVAKILTSPRRVSVDPACIPVSQSKSNVAEVVVGGRREARSKSRLRRR
ncbi:hypothetical protein K523DRAFT_323799 [Schizophyllum commune Tattone D]|nr:hypothetical protein K523DRAFT_323799 [Schizophyllum commune Tattone D]